ncbi:diguanylate cyclase [Euhalothece natronophila Z-M001]|uniref:Diguanylate cyclase n=1 Tax=Euhalothece natronophila Z-M001 TaxID=522448 RepID=A0A5B8NR51_9CHRO|nr:diguanylate cyclase [Euhalothece natronophila]QDZ40981.1 diguanylate cyclase [Euhalothece natronophila Z-M001]
MKKLIQSVSQRIQETVQEISEFLEVDRVAVYQFLEDKSGEVIVESLAQNANLVSLLGLRFPASDIPEVARKRFLEEQVRVLVDVPSQQQIQRRPNQPTANAYVSSSHCHLKYLKQLGIEASLTYPIIIQEELWGLLLIHDSRSHCWQKGELTMLELLGERLTLLLTTEILSHYQQALLHREQTLKKIRSLLQNTANPPLNKLLEVAVKSLGGCGGRIYLQGLRGKSEVYQFGKQVPLRRSEKVIPSQAGDILEESQEWQKCLLEADQMSFPDVGMSVLAYELDAKASPPYSALIIPLMATSYREGYLTIFRENEPETIWWAGRPPKSTLEMRQLRPSFSPWQEIKKKAAIESWTTEEMKLGSAIAQTWQEGFQQQNLNQDIIWKTHNRSLIELPNRQDFTEKLKSLTTEATEKQDLFAVIFLDLDRFQQVNNTLGHNAGDELLKLVSKRLQNHLSEIEGLLAHWHGDKFVILLQNLNHLNSAEIENLVREIGMSFQEPFSLLGHEIYVKGSWGVAISPYDGTDAETLLMNAETAMYSAKEQGRNCYQVYSPSLRSPLNPLTLETEIRNSLQNEDFCLYYQPQVDLETGKVTAVEALIRWQHPEQGLLSPQHFIPFVEESDLICEIGHWVLKKACQQLAQWRENGLTELRVAINISARQFQQTHFVNVIQQVLEETNVPAAGLEIEITETTVAQNVDLTYWTLQKLQEMGVSVALDDFGMGYSSLNAIKSFPLNTLKIDRTFIKEIKTSVIDTAIVNSVIALAQGLNLRLVAEGMENLHQLDALRSMCINTDGAKSSQEVQGYFISHPLSADEMTEFLFNSAIENSIFDLQIGQISNSENMENSPQLPSGDSKAPSSSLQQLFTQTRREQLIAEISQQVHASLDLEEIFQVTVKEIQEFLETDRVILYQFQEDWSGTIVTESVIEPWDSLLDQTIEDPCFETKSAPLYKNGRVLAIEDIEASQMTLCYKEMLRSLQVRANLVIPILHQEQLWGLLIAHHCRDVRLWHPNEITLLTQLATQVGVAIHQAELYQQLQQANKKLEELAIKDGLTQLYNRRWFDEMLDHHWQRLQREQKPLSLILCDIDEFKVFNDHYGHQWGDDCLRQVAQALRSVAYRVDDCVARYGGEEFAIILPGTPKEKAFVVAERARKAVADLNLSHEKSSVKSYVTLSLGIGCVIPSENHSRKELIRDADQALYEAKLQGRDRICDSAA